MSVKEDHPVRMQLVEAAAGLFHRRGFHPVGVAEICKAADVRKGSFYHFFPSKEHLAVVVVEHQLKASERAILQPAFAPDVDPASRVRRYFEMLADFNAGALKQCGQVLGCPFGNLADADDSVPLLRSAVGRAFDSMRQYFRLCLMDAEVADPDLGADALLALMEGSVLIARATGDPDHIRRLGAHAPQALGL